VLTDILLKINPKARVFFLDTGRHFQQTYDLMEETMHRYGFHYEVMLRKAKNWSRPFRSTVPISFTKALNLGKSAVK